MMGLNSLIEFVKISINRQLYNPYINFYLRPMALLVLFAAATVAQVVATNLVWRDSAGRLRGNSRASMSILAMARATFASISSFGTLIESIAFGLSAGFGDVINVCAQIAWCLALRLWPLYGEGKIVAQQPEQGIHDVVLDGLLQIIEHAECFVLELDEGIALSNRAEVNTCTHNIQGVDMVHPQAVYYL